MRAPVQTIMPEELSKQLSRVQNDSPLLLDVRSREENAMVAIPRSTLIPLNELPGRYTELDAQNRDVVVYCHHGMRSQQAAAFLAAKGIKARSLVGGIDAYSQSVDPTLRRY